MFVNISCDCRAPLRAHMSVSGSWQPFLSSGITGETEEILSTSRALQPNTVRATAQLGTGQGDMLGWGGICQGFQYRFCAWLNETQDLLEEGGGAHCTVGWAEKWKNDIQKCSDVDYYGTIYIKQGSIEKNRNFEILAGCFYISKF